MARTGRRPGESGSREAILDAARTAFGERGFNDASVRDIAGRAGVDAALVHHFYGTKEQLFAAAMRLPVDLAVAIPALLEGGVGGLGERVVGFFLAAFEAGGGQNTLLALLRSAASHERSATMVREFVTKAVLGPVAASLDRPDPELRASLVGSQLIGLAMMRYVVKVEPLASADPRTVVVAVAPTIQRYLTGDLG
ncbi:MAG TPA: TetR family transcriptional regulator [Acidimicrobiales bacterium]|nr:TetR family transcriptional regulator [Acidimicrobiales bacterium]